MYVCAVRLACCVLAVCIVCVCNNQTVWLSVGGILGNTEGNQFVVTEREKRWWLAEKSFSANTRQKFVGDFYLCNIGIRAPV